MKLVPVKTLPKSQRGRLPSKYIALIEEFLKMDVKTVRLENTYTNAYTTCKTMNALMKRHGLKGVRAVTRKNEAYLTKEV